MWMDLVRKVAVYLWPPPLDADAKTLRRYHVAVSSALGVVLVGMLGLVAVAFGVGVGSRSARAGEPVRSAGA